MGRLVRGVVKTVAVAGTATATRNAVNRHSAKKNAQAYSDAADEVNTQNAAGAPPPAQNTTAAPEDPAETLKKLADLHEKGVITDEEFEAKKKEELAKM